MEKILKERTKTYSALFDDIGVGNSLHVSTDAYDFNAVRTETQRQNEYARIKSGDENQIKFRCFQTKKEGFITIYQQLP